MTASSIPPRHSIPKRAYYPVLGTGLMANIYSDFLLVAAPLWALMLGATPAQIGIMVGARSFLPFLLAIHAGVLIDRYGTRRMMLIFTVFTAGLVPLYPLCPWFPALVALQMLTGLFTNLGWLGSQTLIARLGKGDPHYLGIFSFTSRAGSIAAPMVIGLIWDLTGHWGAFTATTIAGLGLLVSTWLVPRWAEHGVEGEHALPPEKTSAPKVGWRDFLPRLSDYTSCLSLLAIPAVGLGIAVALLRHTPSTIQSSFYITYLNDIGMSATLIGVLISASEVTGAIGSLVAAPVMRRFTIHWLLLFMTAMTITMMAITPLLGGAFILLAAAQILRGTAHGFLHPATFSFISRSLPTEYQARGVALRTTGNRLGAIVLPIIMGFIAESIGVENAFLLTGIALLGIVLFMAIMVARSKAFGLRPRP